MTRSAWGHRTTVAVVTGILACSMLVMLEGSRAVAASSSAHGCAAPESSATLTPDVDGHDRTVIVHVPRHSSDSTPHALVLNLHGSGSTALEQEEFTNMNVASNRDGFIVAYPQGLIPDGTGYDWNIPGVPLIGGRPVPKNSANDVTFLTLLVGVLEQRYCINSHEVYATGFSGGAREVSQLACDESEVFAAVAPVSGLRRPSPCPATRAVPVIAFHGSADPVDPFAGHGQPYWTYSVPTAAKYWAQQDHCSARASMTTRATGTTLTTYAKCADGATVQLYELRGEGHEWPGGPKMPAALTALLGPQSDVVSANALMWAFFRAHPLSN
ncbi:MAG TPA: PHB depolymerase family esterase [Acidimicrobiales bacterium]